MLVNLAAEVAKKIDGANAQNLVSAHPPCGKSAPQTSYMLHSIADYPTQISPSECLVRPVSYGVNGKFAVTCIRQAGQ